jgi:hypothetical protein
MFSDDTRINVLKPYSEKIYDNGSVIFNPSLGEDLGTTDNLLSLLNLQAGVTFEIFGIQPSRINDQKSYLEYQQFYNGLEVVNGGFVVGRKTGGGDVDPVDPCSSLISFDPYIIEDITVSLNPNIPIGALDNYVSDDIIRDPRLVIVHDLQDRCDINLAYEVYAYNSETVLYYIDAHSGDILLETGVDRNAIPATTPLYGSVDIGDTDQNTGITSLFGEEVASFNTRPLNEGFFIPLLWTEDLSLSTNEESWDFSNPSILETVIFQSHYLAKEAKGYFSEELSIEFKRINIGVTDWVDEDTNGTAANSQRPVDTDLWDQAWIVISNLNGSTDYWSTMDIISHEMAHSFIGEQLLIDYTGKAKSIHEGVADMFGVFGEYKFQDDDIDWLLYDDNPNLVNHLSWDISDNEFKCYDDIEEESEPHRRGQPLSYWFYLITEGSEADGIPGLGIECAIKIVIDALTISTNNIDYIPFMESTLQVVDEEFGICSEKSIAVRRAWEKICVPVDLEDFDGCDIEIRNITTGVSPICEEDNGFEICAVGNDIDLIPYNAFHWQIIGKSAIQYNASTGSQVGTAIDGGKCLVIDNIPEFPYYPQTVTIRLRIDGFLSITKRFTIYDCDGDDPTCEEFHDNNFGSNDNQQGRKSELSFDHSSHVKVYNIMGNLIFEGNSEDIKINSTLEHGNLYIYTYYDNLNRLIGAEKVFNVD